MMKILIPLVLLLVGTGGGVGAGLMLKPAEPETVLAEAPCGPLAEGQGEAAVHEAAAHAEAAEDADSTKAYVRLQNQFIVPVVDEGHVSGLVVLSLSVEVPESGKEEVLMREPRLRDSFLQVLFDHANTGGFDGTFTDTATMRGLRQALTLAAQEAVGPQASSVLITDLVRQDV